ncbi:hypothetical protein K8Q94_02485 [Candidatus Nomurabacteria bacterium]|nr:hypothetical protein [Candidatus Nomurabacteria bacterium]
MEQNKNIVNYHGHYYGKLVRSIFLIGAIIMIVTYPFFSPLISIPLPLFLTTIILLVLVGGLIDPLSKIIFIFTSILPALGLVMFEYYGFYAYQHLPINDTKSVLFFWTNQILALMFFFATYFSVKTLRAMYEGTMTYE